MRTDIPQPVRLADYRPSDYLIDRVELDIKLHATATRVQSKLSLRPNPKGVPGAPLILDGDDLKAKYVLLNGAQIDSSGLFLTPDQLRLETPPQEPFHLEIETEIDPTANTRLMGLYRSGTAYCTQCEAEGFRRITYFLDRPDVLSVYTTRIEADFREAQSCSAMATASKAARSKEPAAISPSGTIPSQNPAISSLWSAEF